MADANVPDVIVTVRVMFVGVSPASSTPTSEPSIRFHIHDVDRSVSLASTPSFVHPDGRANGRLPAEQATRTTATTLPSRMACALAAPVGIGMLTIVVPEDAKTCVPLATRLAVTSAYGEVSEIVTERAGMVIGLPLVTCVDAGVSTPTRVRAASLAPSM